MLIILAEETKVFIFIDQLELEVFKSSSRWRLCSNYNKPLHTEGECMLTCVGDEWLYIFKGKKIKQTKKN